MSFCNNPVLEAVTVDDFKELFFRDFPYLPVWKNTETYNTNDEVYYYDVNKLFYKALKDGVVSVPTTADWEKIEDSIYNYVLDQDIEKAFNEACTNMNTSLAVNDDILKLSYLYLTAHYLVMDIRASQAGLASQGDYPVNSRSVGSVSESYSIPEAYLKDPVLSYYTKSAYGLKYLSIVIPQLRGNVASVCGGTNP